MRRIRRPGTFRPVESVSVKHDDGTIDSFQRAHVGSELEPAQLERLYWDEIRRVTWARHGSRAARFASAASGRPCFASARSSTAGARSRAGCSRAGRAGRSPGRPTASRTSVAVEGFAPLLRGPLWRVEAWLPRSGRPDGFSRASRARRTEMRVAVVGATGTIGRPLVEALSRAHEVVGVARRPPRATTVDVDRGRCDRRRGDRVPRSTGSTSSTTSCTRSGARGLRGARPRGGAAVADGAAAPARADRLSRRTRRGAPDLSPHLRSRAETAKILAAGAVPLTTLRAAMIVGPAAPLSRRSSRSSIGCR